MPKLSIQHAHQQDTVDELGEVNCEEAISAFQKFPWREQCDEANRLRLCSPSLFLKDDKGNVFFAAILDFPQGSRPDFMLFVETEEEIEKWSWFKKVKVPTRKSYDSSGHNEVNVESAIKAFCNSHVDDVKKIISTGD